jgi:hypothetical protein
MAKNIPIKLNGTLLLFSIQTFKKRANVENYFFDCTFHPPIFILEEEATTQETIEFDL